jgi:hypothetical protein
MAEKKKKQTSFGQFDTGGAVSRQRTADRGRREAEADNAVKDRATRAKRGEGSRSSQRNAVANDEARRRRNVTRAERGDGVVRRD